MMPIEIERKFLVKNTQFKQVSSNKTYIKQGFLNSNKHRVVRVRIFNDQGILTVKGISNDLGTSRFEWEKKINLKEAEQLMNLCEPGIIEKHRYIHKVGNHVFEIDEFLGDNSGLIIAEVELNSEFEEFIRPDYLGEEVTGIEKYYNSELSKNPFQSWT